MGLKLCILLSLIGGVLASFGQKPFVVKGRIRAIKDGAIVKVIQWYGPSRITLGKDTVRDGRFDFPLWFCGYTLICLD